ncbi:Endonuclease/exonuclease/phosphatase [Tuber brumale]|nr:Endonuclease/exonuclease/phosphatase [Tuber brumale]
MMLRTWVIGSLLFTVEAATTGSLRTLLYNVAGLPGTPPYFSILASFRLTISELLSSSRPSRNTPYISQRLTNYDLINVQEDFNYHAALYASDAHPYRTSTSGGVLFGDGLNTLSNFPFMDFTRIGWTDCYINSGDCLTPKGFTSMRVQLDPHVWVDVYNLHADAGSHSGDLDARRGNVDQIVEHIKTFSAGMPVVIMGDTNMRYTTVSDSARALGSGAGATDAWVQTWKGGVPPPENGVALSCPFPFPSTVTDQATLSACETVDKILYRSSPVLTLNATGMTNEHRVFVHPTTGDPLSDHYPLSTTLGWTTGNLRLSHVSGGPHGNHYNDIPALSASSTTPSITTLTLSGGKRLDRISASYDSIGEISHGGSGGSDLSITLGAGETIVGVYACSGEKNGHTRVFYLKVTTSADRTLDAGRTTENCVNMEQPESGFRVAGFWGRSGDEVDRVGVIWAK